jgi:hypothetical protein
MHFMVLAYRLADYLEAEGGPHPAWAIPDDNDVRAKKTTGEAYHGHKDNPLDAGHASGPQSADS